MQQEGPNEAFEKKRPVVIRKIEIEFSGHQRDKLGRQSLCPK